MTSAIKGNLIPNFPSGNPNGPGRKGTKKDLMLGKKSLAGK